MNKIIGIVICVLMFSCKANHEVKREEVKNTIETKNNILYPLTNDTITINITDNKGEAIIHKKETQTVYIKLKSDGYTKLSANLTSNDSTANVRFSQIIMPNGEMDGPFGRDIQYNLPLNGDYILTVNENIMAGDPWEGNFKVSVTLGK